MAAQNLENETDLAVEKEEDEVSSYVVFDLLSYPSDFNLETLKSSWDGKDVEIPLFQRKYVWTIKQASALIESFLSGLPVPPVFFYQADNKKLIVIDGQQRIRTIVDFLDGYYGDVAANGTRRVFALELSNKSPFNAKRYVDLNDDDRRKLRFSTLRGITIRQISPQNSDSSMYQVFERLNTGGTPLKPQEIRNCVYYGPFVDNLQTLNKLESWRKIVGRDDPDRYQKDVELLLRIFSLWAREDAYERPFKGFLNDTLALHRQGDTAEAKDFFARMPEISKNVVAHLKAKPFHLRAGLNSAAMDAVMVTLLKGKATDWAKLPLAFKALTSDTDFKRYTERSTADAAFVKGRLARAAAILP